MKEAVKKVFLHCPKCGAEITKINFGNIEIETCANCQGLFVDYSDLKSPLIKHFEHEPAKKRQDLHVLDKLAIECPKCHTAMKKKKHEGRGPMLDVCPSCQAIWFDQGELFHYRQKKSAFEKPEKMRLRLVCEDCNLSVNYEDAINRMKSQPKCSRCGQWLSFEGFGEIVGPKTPPRDIVAGLIFIAGTLFFYFMSLRWFETRSQAILFAGTLGAGTLIILIRAILYGKFSFESGSGPGLVRDFDV